MADSRLVELATHGTEALLFGNDIEVMKEHGFSKQSQNAKAFCRQFTVVEATKNRRRIIGWPRATNVAERQLYRNLIDRLGRPPFARVNDVRNAIDFQYAASLDFKHYFQQFELNSDAAAYFCFLFKGDTYAPTTVPTGAVGPPLFSHALSRCLLLAAIRTAKVTATVFFDVMIDNLRLFSNSLEDLQTAWLALLQICKTINIAVDIDSIRTPGTPVYDYLGMTFNHSSKQVTVAPKTRLKLQQALSILSTKNRLIAVDALAIFGVTLFAASVLNFSFAKLYYTFKLIRRVKQDQLLKEIAIWPIAKVQWSQCLEQMLKSSFTPTPRPHPETISPLTGFSDASDTGYGVVIFHEGKTLVTSRRWSATEVETSINVRELFALRALIRAIAEIAQRTPKSISAQLFVDNTTARSWAIKGYSHGYLPNLIAGELKEEAKSFTITSIDYIASANNPADAPSRE